MRKEYRKNDGIYNDNLFFDNEIYGKADEVPRFNLETLARNAAQRIIQTALEAEVTEFLERSKYDKTEAENFRGYRNGHHRERVVSTAVGFDSRMVSHFEVHCRTLQGSGRRCFLT